MESARSRRLTASCASSMRPSSTRASGCLRRSAARPLPPARAAVTLASSSSANERWAISDRWCEPWLGFFASSAAPTGRTDRIFCATFERSYITTRRRRSAGPANS